MWWWRISKLLIILLASHFVSTPSHLMLHMTAVYVTSKLGFLHNMKIIEAYYASWSINIIYYFAADKEIMYE